MNALTSLGLVGGGDGANPRSQSSTAKAEPSRFDALLNAKPDAARAKPAARGPDKPTGTAPDKQPQARQPDRKPAETAPTEATEPAPASLASRVKPAADEDTPADPAWPPFGLAGILPLAPEPADATPVPPLNQGLGSSAGKAQALPTTAPPLNTLPLPATAQADAQAVAEPETLLPPVLALQAAGKRDASAAEGIDSPSPANFSQLLHANATLDVRAPSPASALNAPTATPDLHAADFDETMGARVSWLAEQKIGHAHIRITPHDLGQVEVKLQLDGDRVHASFCSAHAEVRHALESSLPRLREMLGEQGLQLAQADVGQQPAQQQGQDAQNTAGTGSSAGFGNEPGNDAPAPASQTLRLRGLLDAYA